MVTRNVVVLTCEHAGNRVPGPYTALFQTGRAQRALCSHRGYDPGATAVAAQLARTLDTTPIRHTVTRLLVEVNRSLHHPALFSEFSTGLTPSERQAVLDRFYHPHRRAVEDAIAERIRDRGRAIHLAVHSFTPRRNRTHRRADIGLLYDPSRSAEAAFCSDWSEHIRELDSTIRVRRNYPYRGAADGLTTHLRRLFHPRRYLGIELEVNQRWLRRPDGRQHITKIVARALERLMSVRR